jgi:hypothetical protein
VTRCPPVGPAARPSPEARAAADLRPSPDAARHAIRPLLPWTQNVLRSLRNLYRVEDSAAHLHPEVLSHERRAHSPTPPGTQPRPDARLRDGRRLRLEAGFLKDMLKALASGSRPQAFPAGAGRTSSAPILLEAQALRLARAGGVGLAEIAVRSPEGPGCRLSPRPILPDSCRRRGVLIFAGA